MNVEVIAIGNEVLWGYTVNSNAATISAALAKIGLAPSSHRVVPDRVDAIREGIERSLKDHQLVICCGGLGPTGDDTTRRAAAEIAQCSLVYFEEVAQRLEQRLGPDFPTIEDQATIPEAAKPLHNTVGTAPGLLFSQGGATLLFLPGVPVELAAMLHDEVIPYLKEQYAAEVPEVVELRYVEVPEVAIDPTLREVAKQHPDVSCGIYPGLGIVTVRLTAKGVSHEELLGMKAALSRPFASHILPDKVSSLEEAVHRKCVEQGLTLATAESCTGGAISACITRMPGASGYFRGGCVVYSDAMKETLLGVKRSTLQRCGAVSQEVVTEMVSGLVQQTRADLGVAISGIAGPTGGSADKPVGTVWIATQRGEQQPVAVCAQYRGNRTAIVARSVNAALAQVWREVCYNRSP